MVGRTRRFALADSVQQIVGGFILAGAFVVTEEVWVLARSMSALQALATVAIVCGIGYGTLYKADEGRDPDREADVGGVPLRFVSLIVVSYLSVVVLALAFDAPWTFLEDLATDGRTVLGKPVTVALVTVTLKATSIGAVFSVVGAATADSLF
jgi:uncharacterized membrane protein